VPVMQMLAMPLVTIERRAHSLAQRLRRDGVTCDTAPGSSAIGGGSLPGETLATCLVRVAAVSPDALLAALRQGDPAVVARIADDRVCLDPRTVPEADDDTLADAVVIALRA
jgi:L-seryl-tRNA(Ser) seleniumtransferase